MCGAWLNRWACTRTLPEHLPTRAPTVDRRGALPLPWPVGTLLFPRRFSTDKQTAVCWTFVCNSIALHVRCTRVECCCCCCMHATTCAVLIHGVICMHATRCSHISLLPLNLHPSHPSPSPCPSPSIPIHSISIHPIPSIPATHLYPSTLHTPTSTHLPTHQPTTHVHPPSHHTPVSCPLLPPEPPLSASYRYRPPLLYARLHIHASPVVYPRRI